MKNPSMLVLSMTLISGTLISISSSTWLGMWMGLEMNLLSFIPMMNKNKSPYESEATMKYFLVQAMASVIFITSILLSLFTEFSVHSYISYIISSSLLMKMGAAPFHFWFPGVMEGVDWVNCYILMTWQKISPFALISYKLTTNSMFMMIVLMSTLVGAVGGLNQNSLRKMMSYSSISHLGWMISAMMINKYIWFFYFFIYSIMNATVIYIFHKQSLYFMSQGYFMNNNTPLIKFMMLISMLSLGGLPPFLGFLPKWMIIQNMVHQEHLMIILLMVMTTLLTLFFYLRMMLSSFLFMKQEVLWQNMNKLEFWIVTLIMLSIMGIPMVSWMFVY